MANKDEKREVYESLINDVLSQVEIDYSDAEEFLDTRFM